ncbi:MAG: NEW3 domain-containing protein [Deltaproteobacteria bacterium]
MKGKKVPCFVLALAGLMASAVFLSSPAAWGNEKEKKDLPQRQILVAPEYTSITVPEGEEVSIDITVANQGRHDEFIDLSLPQVPKGWKARIKTYSFDVSGAFVASDKSKSLTLKAEAEEGTGPGKYTFGIRGQTQDGKLVSASQVTVNVREKDKEKKSKGVNLTTSYPVLQGPTDAKFEFSMEVENKTDKDGTFNLSAQGPTNWEINFKPSYEDKLISSLVLKAGARQSVAVAVKPYLLSEAGKFPIQVKVSAPEGTAEAELTVVLTGTHKIEVGTASGLLSLTAMTGQPANMSFYVKNTGSAPQDNVKLLSFKPENWKVEFKPDKLDKLAPNELKQIEMVVTPSDQALVGDYSVAVGVEGEKASKNLEFRVTVKASTVWGWVGIAIIVLVVLGLVVLFVRMGRR